MEVTNKRFEATLISMLQNLAGCHFVSFDLELSGVPQPTLGSSLQSLQERYSDIKYAAEKYSIVQMGFTIAHEDELSGKAVFHLWPLFKTSPLYTSDTFHQRNTICILTICI